MVQVAKKIERSISELEIEAQLEVASLENALIAKGLVSEDQLRQARAIAKAEAKAALDSLAASSSDKLLEILRGYEGPVQ